MCICERLACSGLDAPRRVRRRVRIVGGGSAASLDLMFGISGDCCFVVTLSQCHARAVEVRVDWMPFAGARTSGHGVGGIPYTVHEMQTEKMMVWRSRALD